MDKKCKTCVYGYPHVECVNCGASYRNYQERKPQTNADYIRGMSDEELAERLTDYAFYQESAHSRPEWFVDGRTYLDRGKAVEAMLDWLRKSREQT